MTDRLDILGQTQPARVPYIRQRKMFLWYFSIWVVEYVLEHAPHLRDLPMGESYRDDYTFERVVRHALWCFGGGVLPKKDSVYVLHTNCHASIFNV